ncbi:hypothetical protein KSF73_10575 [Burkholderiaceae bacterium DAT-1]|nr:hypothetical protein [Burkholderiaceae bacterium DAT-1]
MLIRELQPGDCFVQHLNGHAVQFEVIAVRPTGRSFNVTFRSPAGEISADYLGNAVITPTVH